MPVQMSLSGSVSLSSKFQALSQATRGQALERALTAGALLIQNAAKQNAPFVSGTLRRSIHIGGHEDLNPDGISGHVPAPEISPTAASVYVGTDVAYARRIELGFDGQDSLGRTFHQPARPYLRPAMDENGAAVVREVAEALRDLLRAALQ